MAWKARLGIAMAVKTKTMKPRLDRDLEIRTRAAMTMDARIEAAAIRIIMVADQTVHGHVLAMVKIQRQRLSAP
jgi:hypothetical protein